MRVGERAREKVPFKCIKLETSETGYLLSNMMELIFV